MKLVALILLTACFGTFQPPKALSDDLSQGGLRVSGVRIFSAQEWYRSGYDLPGDLPSDITFPLYAAVDGRRVCVIDGMTYAMLSDNSRTLYLVCPGRWRSPR